MSGSCRLLSVVVLLLGLALAPSARAGVDAMTPPLTTAGTTPSRREHAIVRAMNLVRSRRGLPPLRRDRTLTRAARAHSVDMMRRGYFEHGPFVQRLRHFGVDARYIGENLAWGIPPLTAPIIVQMWIASPPHRRNLFDRSFVRIGVGLAGGSESLVTADFAGR